MRLPRTSQDVKKKLLWIGVAAVFGYAADFFSLHFTLPGSFIAIVYPNMGGMVALAILVGPWIAIGAFIGEFALQAPLTGPTAALGFATAGAAQVFAAGWVARRFLGGPAALSTRGGVLRFAAIVGFVATMISASLGVATLWRAGFIGPGDVPVSWVTWWAADIVSVLLLAPLILLWATPRGESSATVRERALIGGALAAGAIAFLAVPFHHSAFALAMLGLPLVGWAAFRLCSRGVATVSAALGAVAFAQLAVPWRTDPANIAALLEAQTFIALASVVGLVVAASLREERLRLAAAAARGFEAIDSTRNRLLHTFAHELNNPLTPMLLELELLASEPAASGTTDQAARLGTIRRNTLRLSKLVRDLRDVSHLQAGDRLRIHPRKVDVAAMAREVTDSFAAVAKAADVTLHVAAPDGLFAQVDADRMTQVLGNLVDNAIKYSPAGGVVRVTAGGDADGVTVEVHDQGCGLESEQIARLFQPFGQVQPGALQKGGSGLGLHIARGIVETHGGLLFCRSPGPGQGAVFTMRVPRVVTTAPAPVRVATAVPA